MKSETRLQPAEVVSYERQDVVAEVRKLINMMASRGPSVISLQKVALFSPILRAEIDNFRQELPPLLISSHEFSTFDLLPLFRINLADLSGGDEEFDEEETRSSLIEDIVADLEAAIDKPQRQLRLEVSKLQEFAHFNPNSSAAIRAANLQELADSFIHLKEIPNEAVTAIIYGALPELVKYISAVNNYLHLISQLSTLQDMSVKEALAFQVASGNGAIERMAVLATQLATSIPVLADLDSGGIGGIIRHDMNKKVTRGRLFDFVIKPNVDGTGYEPLDVSDPVFTLVDKDENRPILDLSVAEYIEDTLDVIGYYTAYVKSKFGMQLNEGEFKSVFNAQQSEHIVEVGDEEGQPVQFYSSRGFTYAGTAVLNAVNQLAKLQAKSSELAKYAIEVREVKDEAMIPTQESEDTIELYASHLDPDYEYKTIQVTNFTTPENAEKFPQVLINYKNEIAATQGKDQQFAQGLKLIGMTMAEKGNGRLYVKLTVTEIGGIPATRVDVFITYPVDNLADEARVLNQKAEEQVQSG